VLFHCYRMALMNRYVKALCAAMLAMRDTAIADSIAIAWYGGGRIEGTSQTRMARAEMAGGSGGGPDSRRNFLRWWMIRFPKALGATWMRRIPSITAS